MTNKVPLLAYQAARAAWLLVAIFAARACAITVTLSSSTAGSTPLVVGYGIAHYYPGGNTQSWWKYSSANGARIWSSPSDVEGTDDISPWGDNVTTQAQFLSRRSALRANPLSATYIDWNDFNNAFTNNTTSGNNTMKLGYAAQSLSSIDNDLLIVMQRRVGSWDWPAAPTSNSSTDWKNRWEAWQHWYAQAFYYAKNYGTERFQIYNEPDHSSASPLTQDQWLEQLQFAANAVESAIADVNTLYGKSLTPRMHAAVTAGNADLDPGEYGRLALDNLHRPLFSTAEVPGYDLFRTFDYHQYTSSPSNFGDTLADAIAQVDAATSGNGANYGVAISEFNVYTSAGWPANLTADSPSVYKNLGGMLARAANAAPNGSPKELYLFKFGMTGNPNATHYLDDVNSPYNVGGVTKSGQVYRLFAKAFADNEQMIIPVSSSTQLTLAASHDAAAGMRYLYSTHTGSSTSPQTLSIDLTPWSIAPGTQIFVEQVSERYHGDISQVITVPANRQISVNQDADSTVLVTMPTASSLVQATLTATDDAMVVAGSNANSNYGANASIDVRNTASTTNLRSAGFLKFDLSGIDSASIQTAVLKLTGVNPDAAGETVIGHLYGLTTDTWNENTITWNNAPNLGIGTGNNGSGTVDEIRDNFVEGVGSTADIVGQVTANGSEGSVLVDVTDFLRRQTDGLASFLLAREVRFNGDVDANSKYLQFRSSEYGDGSFAPRLLLQLLPTILPGDYNNDGAVDAADYIVWRISVGTTIPLPNDPLGGTIGQAQYDQWRSHFGQTAGSGAGAIENAAVPEPTSALLLLAGLLAMCLCQRVADGSPVR